MAGISSLGFVRKNLQEIKAELEQDLKDIFGSNIDLTPSEPLGQVVAVYSEAFEYMWQQLELAYQSHKVDAVTGLIQDQLYRLNNVIRLGATPTTVTATLIGDNGTIVTAGSIVSNSTTSDQYSLGGNVTISLSSASYFEVSVNSVQNSTLYRITIDAINYDYTSDSDATESEILTGIRDVLDASPFMSSVIDNNDLTVKTTISSELNISFTSTELTVEAVGSYGSFSATVGGAKILPINALDTIETQVFGWNDISNQSAGVTGRDTESDEDFAIRRAQSVGISATNTLGAIVANLNQIDNLTAVTVIENNSAVYDAVNDLDPQHIWIIAQGGLDQDIADTVGSIIPAGIGMKGVESSDYTIPETGQLKTIKFDRPVSVNPYIWVEITTDPNEYPSGGSDLIKQAIQDYFDENSEIGEDLLYSRLYTPINSVPGHYVTKLILSESVITGAEPGVPVNIVTDPDELIVIDQARITVVES